MNINTQSLKNLTVRTVENIGWDSYDIYNRYELFGLQFQIKTIRNREVGYYATTLVLPLLSDYQYEKGNVIHVEFSKWAREYIETKYALAFGSGKYNTSTLRVYTTHTDRASAKCLNEAHNNGVFIAETLLVEVINKYVEILFNHVDKEIIQRQIDELQSQLATL